MSRTVVFDELCGDHDEFRAIYRFDEGGRPLHIKSLERKIGKRKTMPINAGFSLAKFLGVTSVCKTAQNTQKPFEVLRNSKGRRRRRMLVGGRR